MQSSIRPSLAKPLHGSMLPARLSVPIARAFKPPSTPPPTEALKLGDGVMSSLSIIATAVACLALADMRFSSIDTKADMRFSSMDTRFSSMDTKFSALEAKIDASIKQNAEIIGSNTVLQDFVTEDLKRKAFQIDKVLNLICTVT